ncbi:hypothetical protein IL330_03393 [Acinetobacter baumannii]|uniref:Uncharacterized protein n=2 Tax=Acinetobacter baumannii TaxID=470 RepID=A0ABX6CEJ7_ACIB2|nr:hypothetical protein F911_03828 [Acinetobacter baumannii ATCC 19606 = CIP 70.34 = JCM 6841]MBN3722252.1 hypothetical protein [Acinetobacter baumannii]KFC03320.1 hypothetical protein DJ41_2190 [Acinetobacter baumannii ATCC 19606 = CIP 70.34 = JCM 6841]QFQ04876.1 hypothetical protein FQU82_01444 [Acinetobacter baumannii]QXV70039.1 hypothetical protein HTZ92_2114 [Acinetobacter baumannii ATCC 19606 = CIP 70.34 = JCM 6841]
MKYVFLIMAVLAAFCIDHKQSGSYNTILLITAAVFSIAAIVTDYIGK